MIFFFTDIPTRTVTGNKLDNFFFRPNGKPTLPVRGCCFPGVSDLPGKGTVLNLFTLRAAKTVLTILEIFF